MFDFNQNKDVIQPIFNFLSQEEAFALRLTCKTFNITATSNQIMMPFLNRLKTIDNKVSVLPPEGKASDTWCYERFMTEFKRISSSQAAEIKDLLTAKNLPTDEKVSQNKLALLKTLNNSADNIQLSALEQKHDALECINTILIKPRINFNRTSLSISSLNITRIPESLFKNPEYKNYWNTLKKIYCTNNKLNFLPESLIHCQSLQELHCSRNQLKALPENLGNLQALTKLSCYRNQLKALPESLVNCQALEKLFCEKNQLQALPHNIGLCRALKWIDCDTNQLQALPESLSECQALEVLYCSHNQLKTLPKSLGHCQALQELFCQDNQIQALPESLANCRALQKLDCDHNQIQVLPEFLGHYPAFQVLYCSNNQLKALPVSLGNCQALHDLFFHSNQIQVLPESLGNCQALCRLGCKNNQLQALPESLGNCQALRILDCRENTLTDIPESLKHKLGYMWYKNTIEKQKVLPNTRSATCTRTSPSSLSNSTTPTIPKIKIYGTICLLSAAFISLFVLTGYAAISIISGLVATGLLVAFYDLGVFLKAAFVQRRFEIHNKACDEQLARLTKTFSASTTQTVIKLYNEVESRVPTTQLIQFKNFEIAAYEKIANLEGGARNQAKEEALTKARNFFSATY
ncbi:MAG: leucine-rich repeat domain-containing protein [Proteobacteria bacterium]|nr:leucine-rich repeat domain-containing protein [Pseudomonadota bacterium]